jgi:ABC-type microcin C transport system duplicated ATPase subunit YejF
LLLDPRREARGPSERELYAKILKDQRLNILWLVPGMILFYLAATVTLHRWPELFIKRNGHVGFAAVDYVELRSRRNPRDRGRKRRGKSTFVKILAGIIEPSSGQIFFRGEQVETPTLAFMEAIKSTAIKVLDSKYANWNRDDGFKVMQDFLTRFPKIDGVWAQDDDIALGVLDALRQANERRKCLWLGARA